MPSFFLGGRRSGAVGRPAPALFLHIQKTAGTSVVDFARRCYGARSVVSHGAFLDRPREQLADKAFVSGHFGFDYARPLLADRFSFTFLRDPVERVLSKYFSCRARDPKRFPIFRLAREMGLDEFLEGGLTGRSPLIRAHIWNHQVWQLAHGAGRTSHRSASAACVRWDFAEDELLELATTHVGELDYVGLVERFDEDCRAVFAALGADGAPKAKSNVTTSRPRFSDLSARTQDMLLALTELDRRLYESLLGGGAPGRVVPTRGSVEP